MKEIKRLKRIVAVRTTQRDISAMRLWEAQKKTLHAEGRLSQAQADLAAASCKVAPGEELTREDLERMDVARIAAWEEIAEWQVKKQDAEAAQAEALSQVATQQLLLRQSEKLGDRAEKAEQARDTAAEQKLGDEQARRTGRGVF